MANPMAQLGEQRLAAWAHHPGRPVDIATEMMQLALEVISHTMFSTSVASQIEPISRALRVSLKFAFDSFHNPVYLPKWLPTKRNREFRLVMRFMDGLTVS
jgi:cytochrome P450